MPSRPELSSTHSLERGCSSVNGRSPSRHPRHISRIHPPSPRRPLIGPFFLRALAVQAFHLARCAQAALLYHGASESSGIHATRCLRFNLLSPPLRRGWW
eukprot:scaffold5775_cov106-Isochrysis_galbana.AAC.1